MDRPWQAAYGTPPRKPPSGMFGVLNTLRDYAGALARDLGYLRPSDSFGDQISKLHEEVSELWRAHCMGTLDAPCDKGPAMQESLGFDPELTCAEEELADILERTFELAAKLGVDLERAYYFKTWFNQTRPHRDQPGGRRA